jgi:2-polyprenyl-3-methyl-5-hydroxy-6-metoxy-1,4-benzoquinol methylase
VTPPIDVSRFRREYRGAVRDVTRFVTPARQEVISRHNLGLHPSRADLSAYLDASETRYVRAVELFNTHLSDGPQRALDVGGFLGAYPLALRRLGIPVTLAEVYAYYEGAFDELRDFLASEGIEIWDVDFTEPLTTSTDRFTMVTNMAMLEHLAGSPDQLMRNLHTATADDGAVVVETPNLAYWPKRWTLLRGRTVHPPLEVVYESASPFLGHHREYTVVELEELLRWSGFRPLRLDCFNYSLSLSRGSWFDRFYTAAVYLWPTLLFRNCREVIIALAEPVATRSAET